MHFLIRIYSHVLSDVELATVQARYVLFTTYQRSFSCPPSAVYAFGRELHGYEQLWDDNVRIIPEFQEHVNFYATVTERARRAALQTTFGLREILGRDVARMIGRMVYETRFTNANIWN